MNETKKLPRDQFLDLLEQRLSDPQQWESLEAYALSYLKDRFNCGPVGWFTDLAVEKIYLRLCFRGVIPNTRFASLRVLYELWLKQEAPNAAPDTEPFH